MAERPRKPLFPNPFYVLLLVASTVFTVTVLAYLVSPNIARREAGQAGPPSGSAMFADWIDRTGPTLLAAELVVMLVSGILAMATDRWFPVKPPRRSPPAD